MNGFDCWALLQWAAPLRGLRVVGFRHVRGQVCKRIRGRIAELGLGDVAQYRAFLEATPEEWCVFDGLSVVTVSRFYRDAAVWEALRDVVLPCVAEAALAAGERTLSFWSAGCASGEEAYTLSMLWAFELAPRYPGLGLRILGTDVDAEVLERARKARYAPATLRDLPDGWRERAFEATVGPSPLVELREQYRQCVELRREDVRQRTPDERFHIIACRNMVFTYFEEAAQRRVLDGLLPCLHPSGVLISGLEERVPAGTGLEPWRDGLPFYRRVRSGSAPRGFVDGPLG